MKEVELGSITAKLSKPSPLPLFGESDIERLAPFTSELSLARGEILFHQGAPFTGIYVLTSGRMKLGVISNVGKEKVIELISPGQLIGVDTIFSTAGHNVFAEALCQSHLLHITKAAIKSELSGVSNLCHGLLGTLADRSQRFTKDLESYSLNTGTERVVSFLLCQLKNLAPKGDTAVLHLPVHKGVIASLLNLTQEHFSRILHELQSKGVIKVDGKYVTIPSIEKLGAEHGGSLTFSTQ